MSNTRLTMIFGLGITVVLVIVFGSAILMPDGPIAGLFAPKETGEFLADDLSDITGVWAYPGTAGNEHIYMQFNSDGTGRRDFYVEQRGSSWLVRQDPTVGNGNLGTGEFRAWFEDGHLHLQEIAWRGTQVPKDDPIGVYDAYVTKEAGVPVSLKLIVLEDTHPMRRSYMNQMIADWVGLPAPVE